MRLSVLTSSYPKLEVAHVKQTCVIYSVVYLSVLTTSKQKDYTGGQLPELIDVVIEGGASLFVCAVGVPPKWAVDKLHAAGIPVMKCVHHERARIAPVSLTSSLTAWSAIPSMFPKRLRRGSTSSARKVVKAEGTQVTLPSLSSFLPSSTSARATRALLLARISSSSLPVASQTAVA